MNEGKNRRRPLPINRRAFLYGFGGVAVGLPFLESSPERSAWAAGDEPCFALFVGTGNGVVREQFWPARLGPLTDLSLELSAAGILGDFADRVTFVGGLKYPGASQGDTHSFSYAQMLTGAPPINDGGGMARASAASADVILAPLLNGDGAPPLTLYSGMKTGYINEAMSWTSEGQVRGAESNPFVVYSDLIAGSVNTDRDEVRDAILVRKKSVLDLARDELLAFQSRRQTSEADRARLDQHLSALREIEQSLVSVAPDACSTTALDVEAITAAESTYANNGMVEVVSKLQLDLTAYAFACNLNHVATLQSGDGCDSTRYDVPSNARGWTFHQLSHQIQSDASTGEDPLAVQAHAEIDRLRMETFVHGLRRFDAHQLLDKTLIVWANQFADGRSGSFNGLPIILAGNPYARLRTGQYVEYPNRENGEMLTALARALGTDAVIGTSRGVLDELLA